MQPWSGQTRWPTRVIVTAAAIAAVAVAVGACGSSSDAGGSGTSSGKVVKLGAFAPETGPNSVIFPIAQATAACFKNINAHGGINGHTFSYQIVNDQYNPSLTVNAAHLLVQQKQVLAVVGALGSATNLAVKSYLQSQGVPSVGPGTGSPQIAGADTFMTWQNYAADGAFLARYALTSLKGVAHPKLGVLYQTDGLGMPYNTGAIAEAKQLGATVDSVSFDVSTQDFTPEVSKLKSDGVDAVIFSGSPGNFAPAIQAAQSVSFGPRWLAANYFAVPAVLKGLPASQVNDMWFSSWTPLPTDPSVATALQTMKHYYPSVAPSFYTLEGWLSCEVFARGFQRMTAGGKAPSRAGLIAALNGLRDFSDAYVKHLGYTPSSHNVSESEFMFKYEGSALKQVSPFQTAPQIPASALAGS